MISGLDSFLLRRTECLAPHRAVQSDMFPQPKSLLMFTISLEVISTRVFPSHD